MPCRLLLSSSCSPLFRPRSLPKAATTRQLPRRPVPCPATSSTGAACRPRLTARRPTSSSAAPMAPTEASTASFRAARRRKDRLGGTCLQTQRGPRHQGPLCGLELLGSPLLRCLIDQGLVTEVPLVRALKVVDS